MRVTERRLPAEGGRLVRVKSLLNWPAALLAVTVKLYVPLVPASGVPLSTPVVVLRVTPLGRVPPVTLNVGVGKPVASMVNVPAVPTVNVVVVTVLTTAPLADGLTVATMV